MMDFVCIVSVFGKKVFFCGLVQVVYLQYKKE